MKFLLRQVWSCVLEQNVLTALKKRSSQIRRISVFEHRIPDQVSLFRWKQCVGFPRSFLTFRWMRPQTPFDRLECTVHLPISCMTIASGFPKLSEHAVVKSASFVTLHLRVSESAVLSTQSSTCIFDWMLDVPDSSESSTPTVLISPNSSTSSVTRARRSSSPKFSITSFYWCGSPAWASILETVASSLGS